MRFTLFALLLLISSNYETQDNNIYKFDPRNIAGEKVTLSEIADEIIYTPLDNAYPIGMVYNAKIINDKIFVSAKDLGILLFTREGKLIRKIGKIGRGPGEYINYMNFGINPQNETVYVNDRDNVIKVYSESGNFIRDISIHQKNSNIELFEIFNDKLVIFNYLQIGSAMYNWIILDTLGNLIKIKKRTTPYFSSNYSSRSGVYRFKNNIFYWNSYNDTVFSILPDLSCNASFLLSPGNHRFPLSNFDPRNQFPVKLRLYSIFETTRFIVIRYSYHEMVVILIDKKRGEAFKSILEREKNNVSGNYIGGIFNDLDGGLSFQPQYYFEKNSQEYMVGILDPLQIKIHIGLKEFRSYATKYPDKKKVLEKLASSLKDTDNPVLMIVRLKK